MTLAAVVTILPVPVTEVLNFRRADEPWLIGPVRLIAVDAGAANPLKVSGFEVPVVASVPVMESWPAVAVMVLAPVVA
jgi:hypothetical protein